MKKTTNRILMIDSNLFVTLWYEKILAILL
jgi:hypothetical protein